ncbi:family 5 putative glycoside hydrolase [Thozetella sp. PMI_491]|nr:family 5 putative glycoside hydrolase [Thozetella sp. PMI_491]
MRASVTSLVLWCLPLGRAQILPATEPGPPPQVPIGTSKAPFAKVSGRLFELDGKVGYFAGTNAWWLGHLTENKDVDLALQEIADTQYKVARVWGFGDVNIVPDRRPDPNHIWYQLLNSSGAYINYGEDGLQRLDYVVSAAEKANIRLVLPFVNYWSDYGGMNAYQRAFGGNSTLEWYTDERSQAVYRNYIKVVVNRYKASPAVFSWQLCNEPRMEGGNYTDMVKWVSSTAKYIKSLDPNHMVSTGEEGFFDASDGVNDGFSVYSGMAGSSFSHNIRIPDIDYGVFHLYPSWWSYPYEWGNTWIKEHDEIGKAVGKPVILEEYGTPLRHNHSETIRPWLKTILESGLAADQLWQFLPNGTSVDPAVLGDEFAVWRSDAEFQELCVQHARDMLAKKVA